jgi:hypothetical protein
VSNKLKMGELLVENVKCLLRICQVCLVFGMVITANSNLNFISTATNLCLVSSVLSIVDDGPLQKVKNHPF